MNDVIQQLSEQARANVTAGLSVEEWIKEYNQLFAESIVQSCIDTLFLNGYDDAANQLTKDFQNSK